MVVSFPDPALKEVKGLVYIMGFPGPGCLRCQLTSCMIVTRSTLVAWQQLERWRAEWRVNERTRAVATSIAMDACISLSCCVCTADLQASVQSRRIINPASCANIRKRAIFLRFVRPGFQFSIKGVTYVC